MSALLRLVGMVAFLVAGLFLSAFAEHYLPGITDISMVASL